MYNSAVYSRTRQLKACFSKWTYAHNEIKKILEFQADHAARRVGGCFQRWRQLYIVKMALDKRGVTVLSRAFKRWCAFISDRKRGLGDIAMMATLTSMDVEMVMMMDRCQILLQ